MEKIIAVIGFLIPLVCLSQDEQGLLNEGNELYKKQQYEQAAKQYQQASSLNSKNPKVHLNLGNALYKTKKNAEAEKEFDEAATNASDAKSKSKALYNKGVSLTRQKKLEESIAAYKQALRNNPKDEQARENLQLALNELKKQPPPLKPKEDNSKDDKQDKKKQPQKPEQKNNSKLNEKQAEQMLSTLRQEEKRIQKSVEKKSNMNGSNAKDW